jgi:nitrite reductase/ring-hydroxylating ferredoxin subunit
MTPPEFIEALDESVLADNRMEIIEIQSRKIVFVKTNGRIYALDNTCPHLGGSLGRGTLQEGKVICPLHHWTFDITTGKAVEGMPGEGVAIHEAKVENGKILVKLT